MKNELNQIRMVEVVPGVLRVHIRQNNFVAGDILLSNKTFYCSPRTNKNIMHLYHGAEGGLGLNSELLGLDLFETIKVKFNDTILVISRLKWLTKGVVSKYCNNTVDSQLILKLSEINMDVTEKQEASPNTLFELNETL